MVKIVHNLECQIYTPNRKRSLLLLLLNTIRFGVLTFPPTLFCSKLQGQMILRKKIPNLIISLQNTQNSFNLHSRTLISHNQRCQESINKTIQARYEASFSSTIKIPLLNPTFCILFSNLKAMRSRNRKSVQEETAHCGSRSYDNLAVVFRKTLAPSKRKTTTPTAYMLKTISS